MSTKFLVVIRFTWSATPGDTSLEAWPCWSESEEDATAQGRAHAAELQREANELDADHAPAIEVVRVLLAVEGNWSGTP